LRRRIDRSVEGVKASRGEVTSRGVTLGRAIGFSIDRLGAGA
jgi:hypothetical protein